MNTIQNINYYLNWIWAVVIGIVCPIGLLITGLISSDLNSLFIFGPLYLLLPIGTQQLLFSIIHVFYYREKSPLRLHLKLSFLALIFVVLGPLIMEINGAVGLYFLIASLFGCFCIGIYCCIVTLRELKPISAYQHSYLDL